MGLYSNDPGAGSPPSMSPSSAPGWSGPYPGVAAASPAMGAMSPTSTQDRDTKWPALRTVAAILKIVAWIEGGLGVISALATGIGLGRLVGGASFLIILFMLVIVAIGFLLTYASAELIMVFISIEKNTRQR